ncbi:MAG: hypothetical protein ACOCSE_01610 [Chitinivibrionales bacterium]
MRITCILAMVLIPVLMLGSCAPEVEDKESRYDESECPFCTIDPGVCTYCNGSHDCPFCEGDGIREVSTENYPGMEAEAVTYEIECPFCHGNGECPYCNGSGECWACDGDGNIENWKFYEKYTKMQEEISVESKKAELESLKKARESAGADSADSKADGESDEKPEDASGDGSVGESAKRISDKPVQKSEERVGPEYGGKTVKEADKNPGSKSEEKPQEKPEKKPAEEPDGETSDESGE